MGIASEVMKLLIGWLASVFWRRSVVYMFGVSVCSAWVWSFSSGFFELVGWLVGLGFFEESLKEDKNYLQFSL